MLLELIGKTTSSATPYEADGGWEDESVDGDGDDEINSAVADSDEYVDSETDVGDGESDEESAPEDDGPIDDVEDSESEAVHKL